jgi:hypothetical protein
MMAALAAEGEPMRNGPIAWTVVLIPKGLGSARTAEAEAPARNEAASDLRPPRRPRLQRSSMRTHLTTLTAALALAGAWACTVPRGHPVTGLTRVVECGGAPPPEGENACQPPKPASGTVTFSRDGLVAAQVRSDDAGQFRVAVAPGTYDVTALLDDFGEVAWCDTVKVLVGQRPRPAPVMITCTVAYP